MKSIFIALIAIFLPWSIKKYFLSHMMDCKFGIGSKIGFSIVICDKIVMDDGAKIGGFNVIRNLDKLTLGVNAKIGNFNWISGFKKNKNHFIDEDNRCSELLIGDESAITHRHLIDCTNSVIIGRMSTFAGFRSQVLTHSISIFESKQKSAGVVIGDYCFVGTSSLILGGAVLPSYSVLAGGSILLKKYEEEFCLYAGNPARPIKKLDFNCKYFSRSRGFVN